MFSNRKEAGVKLASLLLRKKNLKKAVIVAIPRGGTVVGAKVAEFLNVPFKVLVIKKISSLHNPELAVGAAASKGTVYWDSDILQSIKISRNEKTRLAVEAKKEARNLEERLSIKWPDVKNKNVIIVDDGVATGATVIEAGRILKSLGAKKVILATPVISKYTKEAIKKYFDEIITAELPQDFRAVGEFYKEFPQIEDSEARRLISK